MTTFFHVVGNTRSGTTLLTKLLDAAENTTCLEQPFPQLFAFFKRRFEEKEALLSTAILYPHYYDCEYEPEQFQQFLNNDRFMGSDINSSLSQLNSGQLSFDTPPNLEGNLRYSFSEAFKKLLSQGDKNNCLGSKHVLVEEYSSAMACNDIKTIFLLRDPRDVILSSHFGNSAEYVGKPLPLLFALRNWRKSVCFAVEAQKATNSLIIRYEDLVMNTDEQLEKVFSYLNIDGFGSLTTNGLIDKLSKDWTGNSSFGTLEGIPTTSIGRYKSALPDTIRLYIEATCCQEMVQHGYLYETEHLRPEIISDFTEPFSTNSIVDAGYTGLEKNILIEIERLENFLARN